MEIRSGDFERNSIEETSLSDALQTKVIVWFGLLAFPSFCSRTDQPNPWLAERRVSPLVRVAYTRLFLDEPSWRMLGTRTTRAVSWCVSNPRGDVVVLASRTHTPLAFCTLTHSHTHGRFSDAAAPARGVLAGLLLPVLFLLSSEGSGPPLSPSVSAPCRLRLHLLALVPRPDLRHATPDSSDPPQPPGRYQPPQKPQCRPRQALPAPLSALPTRTYRPSCTLRQSHRHDRPCPLVFRELLVFDVGHPMLLARADPPVSTAPIEKDFDQRAPSRSCVVLPRSMNTIHRLKITVVRVSHVIFENLNCHRHFSV